MKKLINISLLIILTVIGCKPKIYREVKILPVSDKKNIFKFLAITYSDSIDRMSSGQPMPHFILDADFDYDHNNGVWAPFHAPLPLRKIIIEQVKSCSSLKMLLDMDLPELRVKPHPEDNISTKYDEFSFYQLIESRYASLNCNNN